MNTSNKSALSWTALGLTVAACLTALPARAAPVTWVAESGSSDSNSCSNSAPCKTLAHALSVTDAGGEIRIIGHGSFGAVVIKKSVSIISADSQGGILGNGSTAAVLIQAGPVDIVNLRGLIIEGAVAGVAGLRFESGGALHVQNSVIRGFQNNTGDTGYGIQFVPTGSSELFVSDTLIADNGGFAPIGDRPPGGGILIAPSGVGGATVVLDRVHVEKNNFGIRATVAANGDPITVTVRDSVIAGNRAYGIGATSDKAFNNVAIDRCAVVNSALGILLNGASATAYVANSMISGHTTGLSAGNGAILNLQMNNSIFANSKTNIDEPPPGL